MNSSDTERRAERPSIWAYRGQGVNIRFVCCRCDKPSDQKGSKVRRVKGVRRQVCAACFQEMTK